MARGKPVHSLPTLALASLCASVCGGAETAHPHWSYSGATDPAHWAALEHDFETCAKGTHQSPVDIPKSAVHESHLGGIAFAYQPAPLPQRQEKEMAPAGVRIDVSGLLPADRSYYHFEGSLTTPPCTEGVNWFVLRHPATLSSEQLGRFAQRYPMNARPVQPLDGRVIDAGG